MPIKISHAVCEVSLELLTASRRLYGLTGVSLSAPARAASDITPPTDHHGLRVGADHSGKSVASGTNVRELKAPHEKFVGNEMRGREIVGRSTHLGAPSRPPSPRSDDLASRFNHPLLNIPHRPGSQCR